MKRVLENDFLKVTIDDHGAELVSIYDKEKDREVIWQGDPRFWGRHAPVLFPNVGKHYGNHYRIGDKEYASKQHGFARDTDFTCIDSTLDSVTHQIRSTEETKEVYPFDFVLRIRHILKGRTLTVSWKVANNSDTDMYFARLRITCLTTTHWYLTIRSQELASSCQTALLIWSCAV